MPLMRCRMLDSPTLPRPLRLPNMVSFRLLMKWHVSCFRTGARSKKGYIIENPPRTAVTGVHEQRKTSMGTTPAHTVHTTPPSLPADTDALLQAYAPLVKYVAQRLACRLPASVCLDDLLSAGALGLMDAIAKYDPTRGTAFKTYAELRMRGAMLDALREWDWAPRSVREKEHALTNAYATLERQHG